MVSLVQSYQQEDALARWHSVTASGAKRPVTCMSAPSGGGTDMQPWRGRGRLGDRAKRVPKLTSGYEQLVEDNYTMLTQIILNGIKQQ
jgi:hypothetical protein